MANRRAPTVIQVPALCGVGTMPPVQVPLLESSIISLVNLSNIDFILCNDDTFTTTWPLPAGATQPEPGIDNLWIRNPNTTDGEVLVLTYDARFPGLVPQPISGSSGYASLTGAGQTTTPGALDQQGDFTIDGQLTVYTPGFVDIEGDTEVILRNSGGIGQVAVVLTPDTLELTTTKLGMYGVTPVVQAATPSTLAEVITILQNLGVCA